jgi:hypothetical protein
MTIEKEKGYMEVILVVAAILIVYAAIRVWVRLQKVRHHRRKPVPIPVRMRRLRFIEVGDGYWHQATNVGGNTTFNLTINPETGDYAVDVLDELFGGQEFYGRMKPDYRDAIISEIDKLIEEYYAMGFNIRIDHEKYGVVPGGTRQQ